MTLITVDRLSAFYENTEIFKDLSFSVNKGDYLCVTGENGSGKTTLMRCILGFPVKHTGTVMLNGFSKKEIGWLPQRSEVRKDFPASVEEIIFSGFCGKGIFLSKADRKKADENIETLGIAELKKRSFAELSGGQQQKVMLCRAMCAAKEVLLLDEPVTGLDTDSQNEMYALIRQLNLSGMTIIMISHDVERAVAQSNRVLTIGNDDYHITDSDIFPFSGGDL